MIKFDELKDKINAGESVEKVLEQLQIEQYLTLSEKLFIIEGTEDNSGMIKNVIKEDGIWTVDKLAYEMFLTYNVCHWYGNIEFNDFDNDAYDFIHKNGIFDYIIQRTSDYYKFIDMFEDMIYIELKKRNSLEAIAVRYLDKFVNKLDEISNPEKLKQLGETFKEITDKNPVLLELLENDFKTRSGKKKKVK